MLEWKVAQILQQYLPHFYWTSDYFLKSIKSHPIFGLLLNVNLSPITHKIRPIWSPWPQVKLFIGNGPRETNRLTLSRGWVRASSIQIIEKAFCSFCSTPCIWDGRLSIIINVGSVGSVQWDQIGWFFKVFGNKVANKSSPNRLLNYWAILKKPN